MDSAMDSAVDLALSGKARPGPPPGVQSASARSSKINSLVPSLHCDPSATIACALDSLFGVVERDDLVDADHELVNHQILLLLQRKLIVHPELLVWLASTMFWCIFESPFDIDTCARYAESFRKVCRRLKKADASIAVDWRAIVKFLDDRYLKVTHRYVKRFEDEAIRKVCRAVKKCRRFIPTDAYPDIVAELSGFDSVEAVQRTTTLLALLAPFDSLPACPLLNDAMWSWGIKHITHAAAEIVRVACKRKPEWVHDTDIAPLVDSCVGFFELVPLGRHKRVVPFKGTLGHHCKVICSSAFDDLPVVLGSCFGRLCGRGDDLVDEAILQFLRQLELLMYPGTTSKKGRENALQLLQRMFSTFAKRADKGAVDKQKLQNAASLTSVFIQRVMHEKDLQTAMLCQGLARSVSFLFPDLLLQPMSEFYFGAVSSCVDPRRIAISLSIMASLSKDVLGTQHGQDILVDLLTSVANTLDSNDHFKTIAVANFVETMSLHIKSPDSQCLGECEADMLLHLWDRLESYIKRLINHGHDDVHSTDKSLLEYVFGAFGRFLGLFTRTLGRVVERIVCFVVSHDAFVIRRSFKLFVACLGKIGAPNALDGMYCRVRDQLLTVLPTANVERPFKDRCCDDVLWLAHVLSSLVTVLRPRDAVDVVSQLQESLLKTNNVEAARAFGKVFKSTVLAFGSSYVEHYASSDALCTLDDVSPCWHVATEDSMSVIVSALERLKLDSFANLHCRSIVLFEATKAVMHVKACLRGQPGEWAARHTAALDSLVEEYVAVSFALFERPDASLDVKEIVLKNVFNCLFFHGVTTSKQGAVSASFRIFSLLKKAYRSQKQLPLQLLYQKVSIHEAFTRSCLPPSPAIARTLLHWLRDRLGKVPKSQFSIVSSFLNSILKEPNAGSLVEGLIDQLRVHLSTALEREDEYLSTLMILSCERLAQRVGASGQHAFLTDMVGFVSRMARCITVTKEIDQSIEHLGSVWSRHCSMSPNAQAGDLAPAPITPASSTALQRLWIKTSRCFMYCNVIEALIPSLSSLMLASGTIDHECAQLIAEAVQYHRLRIELDPRPIFAIRLQLDDSDSKFEPSLVTLYRAAGGGRIEADLSVPQGGSKSHINAHLELIASKLPVLDVGYLLAVLKHCSLSHEDSMRAFLSVFRFNPPTLSADLWAALHAELSLAAQAGMIITATAIMPFGTSICHDQVLGLVQRVNLSSDMIRGSLAELLGWAMSKEAARSVKQILENYDGSALPPTVYDAYQDLVVQKCHQANSFVFMADLLRQCQRFSSAAAFLFIFQALHPYLLTETESTNNVNRRIAEDAFLSIVKSLRGGIDALFTLVGSLTFCDDRPKKTRLLCYKAAVEVDARHLCFSFLSRQSFHNFSNRLHASADYDELEVLCQGMANYFFTRPDAMLERAAECTKELGRGKASLSRLTVAIYTAKALFDAVDFRFYPWIPDLQCQLARHVNAAPPLNQVVRSMFLSFKARHRDSWSSDCQSYSPEQLELISDLLVSPSYYV